MTGVLSLEAEKTQAKERKTDFIFYPDMIWKPEHQHSYDLGKMLSLPYPRQIQDWPCL